MASGLAENASILREQQNSAPDIVQNVNPSPFSSPPGRGRGSFRGRFRGTMANPYEFFDMHTRGGRGRFSSNRAHFQWESQNQNQHHNTSMEFNAANDTTFYNNHFPALQPIYRNNSESSINPSRINNVTANVNQNQSNDQIHNNQQIQNRNQQSAITAVPLSSINVADFTPNVTNNIRQFMDPQNTNNNNNSELTRNNQYVYNAYNPNNYMNNNNFINGQSSRTQGIDLLAQNRSPSETNTNHNESNHSSNSSPGTMPAFTEPSMFGNGIPQMPNHSPTGGNVPNPQTPSQVSNYSYNSINNQFTPQQTTLFQMSNRQLVEIDNKVRAIDRIRIQDFLRLTNENVHEFSVWQKRFELQMTINDIEFTIRTDFRLGVNIEWPTPTDGVFQNCPQLLQALLTACRAEERLQLKAVAKTMAILIYVLTDSKSMQLVHNVTVDTKPNELYGAVIRLHMNVTINKRMGATKRLYQIEKIYGESITEFI